MSDIDLNSDEPIERPSDAGMQELAALFANAKSAAANAPRKRGSDPDGSRVIAEDRMRYRQTFVKLRYVLVVDQTTCRCGSVWNEPQGIYEESQSSKGGALNLARVAAWPHDIPRVIRFVPHACTECPTCATAAYGFTPEHPGAA